MRNLIGGLIMFAGYLTVIGLSLYLLITGLIYLFQHGPDLTGGEIVWEVIKILLRDVVAVIVGLIIIVIGAAIMGKRKRFGRR